MDAFLQVHNVIFDRRLDPEDITVILYKAADYAKFIVSHGRVCVHNDVEV
jgi:hypothetical protein